MSFVSKTKITVRYAETDMMGIVYHSRYYPWFEVARGDFIKAIGMKYSEMEHQGVMIPLTETWAKYHYGLRYEDEVVVTCKLTKLSVAKCEFKYEVYKLPEMKLMTEGKTSHGFVNSDMQPINLKRTHPEMWDKLEKLVYKEDK